MRIGIDLGGTKIAGVALDLAGGELASIRTATPRGDYEATILAVRDLVQALERRASRSGTVGIGMPGTMSGAMRFAFQRGGPLLKLFTNFYSFFNVAYNLGVERTGVVDGPDTP